MNIVNAATRHLSRVAITSAGQHFTYEKILEASEPLASAISKAASASKGHPPRIGLFATPDVEYVAGTLAIWKAKGIVVPLAVSHPAKELSYVIQDAGVSVVLATAESVSKVGDVAAQHKVPVQVLQPPAASSGPVSSGAHDAGSSCPVPQVHELQLGRDSEQGAVMIYTSGSTGRPKGVLHSDRSIAAQVSSLCHAWEWTASDRILHCLPLHHIHGIVNALYCPLAVGAHVEMLPKFSPSQVWRILMENKTTVFMGVPTMYSYLLSMYDTLRCDEQQAAAREAAARLRLAVCGSAACPVPVMQRWRDLTGSYSLERYGMTETGMILSNPYKGLRRPGTVGMPLPGVNVKLAHDGEVWVRGPTLFSEYWGRPELTRQAFDKEGYFKTGDIAGITDDDPPYYQLLGRASVDIIKSGGYKLSALQIESAIMEHPAVADCAVLGMPDAMYGEKVVAVVMLRSEQAKQVDCEALKAFCKPRLAPYQIPKTFQFVKAFPRNALGKVNKKELVSLIFPQPSVFME